MSFPAQYPDLKAQTSGCLHLAEQGHFRDLGNCSRIALGNCFGPLYAWTRLSEPPPASPSTGISRQISNSRFRAPITTESKAALSQDLPVTAKTWMTPMGLKRTFSQADQCPWFPAPCADRRVVRTAQTKTPAHASAAPHHFQSNGRRVKIQQLVQPCRLQPSKLTCAATTRQPSAVRTQVWLWRPGLLLLTR